MATIALFAGLFGAALGLRFNVWAMLFCLGVTTALLSIVMLAAGCALSTTCLAAFIVATAIQMGYLAGTLAIEFALARNVPSSSQAGWNQ